MCLSSQKHFGGIFGYFRGQNRAPVLIDLYSWTWDDVLIILAIKYGWFSFFFGSSIAHLEPKLQRLEDRSIFEGPCSNRSLSRCNFGSRCAIEEPKNHYHCYYHRNSFHPSLPSLVHYLLNSFIIDWPFRTIPGAAGLGLGWLLAGDRLAGEQQTSTSFCLLGDFQVQG